MDNSFKALVDQCASILILLPTDPVFDEVAAGLALYLSLTQSKKEVTVACPSPMLVEFNRLVGVNRISTDVGSKNLIIRFKGYQPENIEKVSYDIENKEFKLTVIPKEGFIAPNQSQLDIAYSGLVAQAVILVGGEGEQSYPALIQSSELAAAKIVFLGIQAPRFSPQRSLISFARPVSSVTEIVASLLKESGLILDADIATNLLLGIELASNNFTLSGVSADTFQLVADLVKIGGKREPLAFAKQQAAQLQQIMQNPQTQQQFSQQLQKLQQPSVGSGQNWQPISPVGVPQTPTGETVPQTQLDPGDIEIKESTVENPPSDWLSTPKIYKGTSV